MRHTRPQGKRSLKPVPVEIHLDGAPTVEGSYGDGPVVSALSVRA